MRYEKRDMVNDYLDQMKGPEFKKMNSLKSVGWPAEVKTEVKIFEFQKGRVFNDFFYSK